MLALLVIGSVLLAPFLLDTYMVKTEFVKTIASA